MYGPVNRVFQTEFDGRMKEKCFQPQELNDLIIDQFRGVGLPVLLDEKILVTSKREGMRCLATAQNGRVNISIPHLVHLWAATQQYYLFYSAIVKHAELCKKLGQSEPWRRCFGTGYRRFVFSLSSFLVE